MAENFAFLASFFHTEPAGSMELVPPEINTAADEEVRLSSLIPDSPSSKEVLSPQPADVETISDEPSFLAAAPPALSDDSTEMAASAAAIGPACCRPVPPIAGTSRVRFLNAAPLPFPVDVLIDGRLFWQSFGFGKISDYIPITDGFHTVTVRRASGLRAILFQNQFPFRGNQKFTFVAIDSLSGGLNLVQLSDMGCSSQSNRFGCYRVANMSFPGSSFDIRTAGGDTAFSGIGFGQTSSYKQIAAGSYRFFVTEAAAGRPIREMPVILQAFLTGSLMTPRPLLSYGVNIAARRTYTTYLLGNTWSSFPFQALTVED